MCVCPDWDAECAGQAKICELQLVICTIHQDVLGFHVAVQDASRVAECDAVEHLPKVELRCNKGGGGMYMYGRISVTQLLPFQR